MLARSVKSGRKCREKGLPLNPGRHKWGNKKGPDQTWPGPWWSFDL